MFFFFKPEKDLKALGEYIDKLIFNNGTARGNRNEAARMAEVSKSELFYLCKGERKKPNPEILYKIATALGGDYHYMLALAGIADPSDKSSTAAPIDPEVLNNASHEGVMEAHLSDQLAEAKLGLKRLPILGFIPAGPLNYSEEVAMGTLPISSDQAGDFCLRVRGESMVGAGINDGDTIIVEKSCLASNGDIVVVRVDDEVTLKKFYKTDSTIILQPMNDSMTPIILNGSNRIEIIGAVTGVFRSMKK